MRLDFYRTVCSLFSLALPLTFASTPIALGQCSGVQAPPEMTTGSPPLPVFVAQGQHFHLNVTALSSGNGFSIQEASDILNGLTQWGDVNGISFDFKSAPAGLGVIVIQAGTRLNSDERGEYKAGGSSGVAANQIIGGQIRFDLSFMYLAGQPGSFRAYDPSAPNADSYLTGLAAHAMGHVLGLNDTPDAGSNNQTSTSVMGGQIGANNNGAGRTPPAPTSLSPTPCDQAIVAAQGSTNSNWSPVGTGTSGGSGGSGGPGYTGCGSGFEIWNESTNTLTYYYPLC